MGFARGFRGVVRDVKDSVGGFGRNVGCLGVSVVVMLL